MFDISLNAVSKRFDRDWIFREINYHFTSGNTYAILGPNGSGKSTLIQILTGNYSPTKGEVEYRLEGKKIEVEFIFQYVALCAPYLQLIEEFTLAELVEFHFKFKKMLNGFSVRQLFEHLELDEKSEKQVKNFSSGMKQRVKLGLALFSDVPVLFLDEPATNLDISGIKWYKQLLKETLKDRLLVISSNREDEYDICEEQLNILDYK